METASTELGRARARGSSRDLGWVDIYFFAFHCVPHSAWSAGWWAEWAVELGRMMEHRYPSQPNLGHDRLPNLVPQEIVPGQALLVRSTKINSTRMLGQFLLALSLNLL